MCAGLVWLACASPAAAQSDVMTYQGRLEKDGVPLDGAANLRVSINDAASGGNELYFTIASVTAVRGEFTIALGPFGANVFNGSARWVEIAVDDPQIAGLNYVPLTPRQSITASPYSLRAASAATAATASSLSGSITAAQISGGVPATQLTGAGTLSPSLFGTGINTGTMTFNPTGGGAPFVITNAASPVVANLNADKLDGFDSAAFIRTTGGTIVGALGVQSPATINFGNVTRQMINLWNAEYGIGVQSSTLYQRSGGGYAWFTGGTHNDSAFNPGAGGTALMTLTSAGALTTSSTITGTSTSTAKAVTGVHAATTGEGAGIYGISASPLGFPVLGEGADGGYGGKFVSNGSQGWAVYGVSDTGFAGRFSGRLYASGATTFGSTLNVTGATTLGSNLAVTGSTTLNGEVTTQGGVAGFAVKNRDDSSKRWVMYSRNVGGGDQFILYSDTSGDVASITPAGDLYLDGALSTTVLTIRGGADVAEPFEMTKPDELEPGCVVVIDEEHPGQLAMSRTAYDTKVAGIVSGAGGVKPGLRLHQDGVLEGDHHVALSGRVYVKADASSGAIKPGDLLTTSDTPGHAMKVSQHGEAQGAILGKAMTGLDSGTGLVLVLVTLQ